jgi:1-acyl-sn-glycerol-3-phosphate acyltransferase
MNILTAIFRTIAFVAITSGLYFAWLAGIPVAAVFVNGIDRWRTAIFCLLARGLMQALGVRLRVKGHRPRSPFFLVSNHLSYLDVIVLASQFECSFVAKSEIARWPLIGRLSRGLNTIFIDRRRRRDILRVNHVIEQNLHHGRSVVLFPEGTTTPGEQVLPFKSSLLEPAIRTAIPVAFASLSYRVNASSTPASESVCWWGEMNLLPHLLRLFALPEIEATLVYGKAPVAAVSRKLLAKQLHREVSEIFIPVEIAQEKVTDKVWTSEQCKA